MPILSGKTYVPRNAEEIRSALMNDMRLEAIAQGVPSADVPVEEGTEWWILGTGLGHMMMMLFANQVVAEKGRDLDLATPRQLDEIRREEGLSELLETFATGKIRVEVDGAQTIPDGTLFSIDGGARGKVTPQVVGATDGQEVDVVMIDAGTQGNASAGDKATFASPPGNLRSVATVSTNVPISDGRDVETPAQKRRRIKNRRRNRAGAGNWAANIESALGSRAGIQYAFVYPAIGGPSSRKVVIVRDIEPSEGIFDRSPSEGAADLVRGALHKDLPKETEVVVQAAAEEDTDVAITVEIPDSPGNGGDGRGWLDDTVWPDLLDPTPPTSGNTKVAITAIGGASDAWDIRVDADTPVSPVAGVTHVAWWSSVDQKFTTARVEAVSGAITAWQLKLDTPFVDSNGDAPAIGDYVSPAAASVEAYGDTFRDTMRLLGPGENTSIAALLPRSKRHPFIEQREWPADLNLRQLTTLVSKHSEISDGGWSDRSVSTPTVPGSVATAPNVLKLRHFGIYVAP